MSTCTSNIDGKFVEVSNYKLENSGVISVYTY